MTQHVPPSVMLVSLSARPSTSFPIDTMGSPYCPVISAAVYNAAHVMLELGPTAGTPFPLVLLVLPPLLLLLFLSLLPLLWTLVIIVVTVPPSLAVCTMVDVGPCYPHHITLNFTQTTFDTYAIHFLVDQWPCASNIVHIVDMGWHGRGHNGGGRVSHYYTKKTLA
jgi:hypothetical protein